MMTSKMHRSRHTVTDFLSALPLPLAASFTSALAFTALTAFTTAAFTATAHAAPPITNFEYDANGNLTKVIDGLNHATINTYDKLNRRISSTNANTGLSQYAYNALDQMTQVTDPKTLVKIGRAHV